MLKKLAIAGVAASAFGGGAYLLTDSPQPAAPTALTVQDPRSLQDYIDLCRSGVSSACYKLRPDSQFRGAGTDGKDIGADIDRIILVEICTTAGDMNHPACKELDALETNVPRPGNLGVRD